MAPLLLMITLAASPALRLAVGEDAPCDLARRLAPALRAEGLGPAPEGWLLIAQPEGADRLAVRLTDRDGALVGERVLNATGACDVFPHTLALLVKAWVTQRVGAIPLRLGLRPGVSPPPPRAVPVARAAGHPEVPEASPRPAAPSALQDPTPPVSSPPAAPPSSAPRAVGAGPFLPPVEVPPCFPPVEVDKGGRSRGPPEPYPAPLQQAEPQHGGTRGALAVVLVGGAAVAPADPFTAQGQVLVDWGFLEPWGVTLDLGLQSARTARLGAGAVWLSLEFASLTGRVRFSPLPDSNLQLGLGARLELLSARATGYSENTSVSLLAGGPLLTAQWRQRVTAGLFFAGHAEAHLRTRPETFSIEHVGTALTLPPLSFFAGLGAGWEFR